LNHGASAVRRSAASSHRWPARLSATRVRRCNDRCRSRLDRRGSPTAWWPDLMRQWPRCTQSRRPMRFRVRRPRTSPGVGALRCQGSCQDPSARHPCAARASTMMRWRLWNPGEDSGAPRCRASCSGRSRQRPRCGRGPQRQARESDDRAPA